MYNATLSKQQLLIILLFVGLANTLTAFPTDKLAFILLALSGGWLLERRLAFSWNGAASIGLLTVWLLLSCFFSIGRTDSAWQDASLLIFFMVTAWLLTTAAVTRPIDFLNCFLAAVALYLVFGFIAWGYSLWSSRVFYVMPLYGKGRPDIYAALSFATTPQVFATVAALAAVTALSLKRAVFAQLPKKTLFCRYDVMVMLSILAIIVSLNRVWLLFIPVLLVAWWGRRVLLAGALLGVLLGSFLLVYSEIAFTFGTVSSRLLMIDHMMAFFGEQGVPNLLVGRPFYSEPYFHMHGRDFHYIESAPFFLIAKFGLLSLVPVVILLGLWLFRLYRVAPFLAFFSLYYLVFVQFMTHEFLSVSFWIYWVVMACLWCERARGLNFYTTSAKRSSNREGSFLCQT
jgi:hypothetical protein